MLFRLLPEGRITEEYVGEPLLRGVCGEVELESKEDLRRGREGRGRTIARAGTADGRLACIMKPRKRPKQLTNEWVD
jgi:hypothetical protein